MLVKSENITNYIPQRAPVVMIHALVEVSDHHAITQLLIEEKNIFTESGYLTEPGLVENIAQTAAAQMGYQCFVKNVPVPVGYIAAVKSLKIFAMPRINEVITTSVSIKHKVLDVTVAEGRIEQAGQLYCSCEMRIFVKV
jgi:3-hydroxyacyl-[acyl-carrier-protein] dehydratase